MFSCFSFIFFILSPYRSIGLMTNMERHFSLLSVSLNKFVTVHPLSILTNKISMNFFFCLTSSCFYINAPEQVTPFYFLTLWMCLKNFSCLFLIHVFGRLVSLHVLTCLYISTTQLLNSD